MLIQFLNYIEASYLRNLMANYYNFIKGLVTSHLKQKKLNYYIELTYKKEKINIRI